MTRTTPALLSAALAALLVPAPSARAQIPGVTTPDHIVVVIEENHAYNQIIGDLTNASYINSLAGGGANLTDYHGVTHPSQPNYLYLFSGSNQNVLQDGYPGTTAEPLSSAPPYDLPNLGAELRSDGRTFATYSEGLPAVGSQAASNGEYMRKHNPETNFQAADATATDASLKAAGSNLLPWSDNQPFTTFDTVAASPGGFDNLPTVSFVVPNQQHDMHDGTINTADTWLQSNLGGYAQYTQTHNSLLIVTWDEDNDVNTSGNVNQIPTLFYGKGIVPGSYAEAGALSLTPSADQIHAPGADHLNLLNTLESLYGTAHTPGSGGLTTSITDVFTPAPEPSETVGLLVGMGTLAGAALRRRAREKGR